VVQGSKVFLVAGQFFAYFFADQKSMAGRALARLEIKGVID
jgi:hypothetical protein